MIRFRKKPFGFRRVFSFRTFAEGMNLVIDFGNSLIKVGIFDGVNFIYSENHHSLSRSRVKSLLQKYNVKAACMASVTNDHRSVRDFLLKQVPFTELSHKTKLPIKNYYRTPETLGNDRRANLAGALSLFPKKNALVISAGTCITYDAITSARKYFGGNISPGLEMRLKAMHTFTARLPLVKKERATYLIGRSTAESMLTGAVRGARLEMQGFISEYKKKFPSLHVILTGGDAPFFETSLQKKIFAVPNLALIGLNEILNSKKKTEIKK